MGHVGSRRGSVAVAVVVGLVVQLTGLVGLGSAPAGAGVLAVADLSLALAGPATVVEGDVVPVEVTVTDHGPADAPRAGVHLSVPDGVDVIADEASICRLSSPGSIDCDVDSIPVGSQRVFTVELTGATPGTLTVRGEVTSSDVNDPTRVGGAPAGNDLASLEVEVLAAPSRLTVDLQELDGGDPAPAGAPLGYAIAVRQEGGTAAVAPVVTFVADPSTPIVVADVVAGDPNFADPRPEAVTPCEIDPAAGTATCTLPDLGRGDAAFVQLAVGPPDLGEVTATASVDDPATAAAPDSSDVETTTVVEPAIDLGLQVYPDEYRTGQLYGFNVYLTNQGPSAAGPTTLVGTFPAGEVVNGNAFDDRDQPFDCDVSVDGSTVTCTYPALRPLRSARVALYMVNATLPTLPYRFEVSSAGSAPESNPADDVVEGELTLAAAAADLHLALVEEPATAVSAGDEITAGYRVTNGGPSTATDTVLDLAIPDGWSITDPVGCAAGSCLLGDLPAGGSADLQVRFVVGARSGGVLAVAGSAVGDPNPADNRVFFHRSPIEDQADLASFAALPRAVVVDEPLTGTASAVNRGPQAAVVELTVTLDDSVSDVTVAPDDAETSCSVLGTVISCTRSLAPGEGFGIHLSAIPRSLGSLTMTTAASSDRYDPVSLDDRSTATTDVVRAQADVRLSLVPTTDRGADRQELQVTAFNEGPSPAADAVLTMLIPAGVELVSSTLGCTVEGVGGDRAIRCPLGSLAALDPAASLRGSVTIDLHYISRLVLTGTLTTTTPVVDTADDVATATIDHGEIATEGCGAATVARNDDGSSARVQLPFALDFYGRSYEALYVNNNGNVTFDAPLPTYTPFGLAGTSTPIIAPWFADVDTRPADGGTVTYGLTTFRGHRAFCVEWTEVGYFDRHTDRTNSFGLLLIEQGGGDFDIRFDYDHLRWDTGDASGGVAAAAGFSNGTGSDGQSFELAGSRERGALLDSSPATGLVHRTQGADGVLGRFVFPVRNGRPITDVTPPVVTGATADPPAGATGWYWGDADGEVRVTFAGTDDSGGPVDCVTVTYAGPDDADAAVAGTCTDLAGNVSAPFTFPLPYDRTAPVADCGAAPAAGGAWRARDVAVTCTVTDATSGVDGPAVVTVATQVEPGTAVAMASTGTTAVTDVAGNAAAIGPFGPYAIDRADPTVVVTAPADGATYRFGAVPAADTACTDVGSGIESCVPTAPIDTSVGTHSATFVATDRVGRTSTAVVTYRVLAAVDAGADTTGTEGRPVDLAGDAGGADGVTWTYRPGPGVDRGATCSFDDAGSARTSIRCDDDGTFFAVLTSLDGSAADDAIVTIANATPTVTIAPMALSAGQVAPTITVADLGANDSLTCTVDWGDGTTTTVAATGGTCPASHDYGDDADTSVVVLVTDDDGASSSAARPVRIDRTAPSISITSPADGARYTPGASVLAAYTCTDAVAGVASCTGTTAAGQPVDTTVGHHTFTVQATDALGNVGERTVAYDVAAPSLGDLRLDLTVLGGTVANVDACATVTLPDGSARTVCDLANRRRDGQITFTGLPAGAVQLRVDTAAAQAANYLVVAPPTVTIGGGRTTAVPVTFRRLATVRVRIVDQFHGVDLPGCVTFTAAFDGIAPVRSCVPAADALRLPVGDWTASESTPFGFDVRPDQPLTVVTSPVPTVRFDHRPVALLRVRSTLVGPAPSGQAGDTLRAPCATVTALDGSGSRSACATTGGSFAEIAVPAGPLSVAFQPQAGTTTPPPVIVTAPAGRTTVVDGVYRGARTVEVRLVDADTGAAISLAGTSCPALSLRLTAAFPISSERAPICATRDTFTATLPSGPWNLLLQGAPAGYAPNVVPVAWDGLAPTVAIALRSTALRVRFELVGAATFVHNDCASVLREGVVVASACIPQGSAALVATATPTLAPGAYVVRFPVRTAERSGAATGTSSTVALTTPADVPVTLGAGGALAVGTYRALNRVRLVERDAETGVAVVTAPAGTPCWTLTPQFTGPAPVVACGLDGQNAYGLATLPAGDWRVDLTTPVAGRAPVAPGTWNGTDNATASATDRPTGLRIRWAPPAGLTFAERDVCATVQQAGATVARPCATLTAGAYLAHLPSLAPGTYVITFDAERGATAAGLVGPLATPPPVTVTVGTSGSAFGLGTYRRFATLGLRAIDADRGTLLRSATQPCFELVPGFAGPTTRTVCGTGTVPDGGSLGVAGGPGSTNRLQISLPDGPWTIRQVSTIPGFAVDPAAQSITTADQNLTFRDLPVL